MTDSLKAYLQGDFLKERQEVERINQIVEEVWPLFLDFAFFDSPDAKDRAGAEIAAGWPYEIRDGVPPKPPDPKGFSYSTNAMILFLIGVVLETVKPGALVPAISISKPESGDEQSGRKILENGMSQIAQRSNGKGKPNGQVVYSGSFGKNDPFTITWLLELLTSENSLLGRDGNADLLKFKSNLTNAAIDRLKSISEYKNLLEWGDSRQGDRLSADHMFPLLRFAQISRILERDGIEKNVKEKLDKFRSKLSHSLLDRFKNRMHKHISLETIASSGFDAAELAFAVEGILLIQEDPQALEPDVLSRVFEIIKRSQEVSPYWRPQKPFVTTPQGFALLPLSVEIASSLLRICRFVDDDPHTESCFSKQIDLFKRYTAWLHARKVNIRVPNEKETLPYSGWHSEHVHVTAMIHPWETSQVLIFLLHYQAMLKEHISRASMTAAQLTFESRRRKSKQYAKDAIQEHFRGYEPLQRHWAENQDLASLGEITAYATLLHRFVAPRRPELGLPASKSPMYSALIYGPPGTGKTLLARELANALDWELLTLTPSNFIAGGESEVESRAKDLFEMLQQQDKVVILFDEIDRLILDRDSPMYLQQGDMFQLMTPSMLIKLNNLRACKRSIFLIATNYEERIDRAVKRVGRIDCQLMLPPPDEQQRERILLEAVRTQTDSNEDNPELNQIKREESWKKVIKTTVLATYGELTQLVDRAIERAVRPENPQWGAEDMADTLLNESTAQWTPAIRLSSYERRFVSEKESDNENGKKFIAGQCPFQEFFVLVHLVQESKRTFLPEERTLLKRIQRDLPAGKNIDNLVENLVPDTAIAESVRAAFKANT